MARGLATLPRSCRPSVPMRFPVLVLLSCGLLSASTLAATSGTQAPPDRRIAITIDDLPWQRIERTPVPDLARRHAQLIAQLRQADAPVTGFVNEGKLELDGEVQPARM